MTTVPALADPGMQERVGWPALVARMLQVEAALARAQAAEGVIPVSAADGIAAVCAAPPFDADDLADDAAGAGTPVIPLVRRLSEALDGDAARYVHFGATSQDVLDTAMVLQARAGIDLLDARLATLGDRCAALADEHRGTLMVGRTLLQHAVPITFGLKAAHWLATTGRSVRRLRDVRARLPVQCGGAAGTLAPLGDRGAAVVARLADDLGLADPVLPWHADRDVVAEIATAVGLAATGAGGIATDVILLMQTEVGEMHDPQAGGSSAMPHKANPVDPTFAVAASRLAAGAAGALLQTQLHPHERAPGDWQAEWAALPELFVHAGAAVRRMADTVARLQVDVDRMRANLDLTGGAVMAEALRTALTGRLDRAEAGRLVAEVAGRIAADGDDLRTAAGHDPRIAEHLDADDLNRVLDPDRYLGSSDVFVDRALTAWTATVRP